MFEASVRAFLIAATCATAAIRAQTPAGEPGTQQQGRLFVDSVVASVNDSAILQSKVFAASDGTIIGAEAQAGRSLTLNEVMQVSLGELRKLVNDYQMAQSARSFGTFPPERFDMILESELERDKLDRVRDLGSYGELSAELERTGQTWQTYAAGQRIEKLQMLAEQFAIYERLRKQSNLYLTPRMLRETYQEYKDRFVRPALAQVSMVTFRGTDARQRAQEASDLWSNQVLTAREVADRYPGSTPLLSMRARSLQPKLREFALQGPAGAVSQPIPRGNDNTGNGTYDVVKVMQFVPARNGRFEDPEVQGEVREIASNKIILEFRLQALDRAKDRTEVWLYRQGRREPMR